MRQETKQISTALTQGVRVVVRCRYVPDQSFPAGKRYVFAYTVRIGNEGTQPLQLSSRHWTVTDGTGKVEDVLGPG